MNNVSLVGKVMKTYDITTTKSTAQMTACVISIPRPYRVNGAYKFDTFLLRARDRNAEMLLTARPGQIIGVTGVLENDKENKTSYIYVRTLFFYSHNEQAEIDEACIPDEQIEAFSGFYGVMSSEFPDF